jgi:prevent-host-death family protein
MKTITMLDLRRDARRWIEAVRRGERLVLTYRGKPVARLEPVPPEGGEIHEDDPLLRIDDFAVDGPADRLTNEEIDRLVYGT